MVTIQKLEPSALSASHPIAPVNLDFVGAPNATQFVYNQMSPRRDSRS